MSFKEYTVRVYEDGGKFWYLNDKLHRVDGPAVECANGDKLWYLNGERHREDGPAVELAIRDKRWFLNDIELTEGEFLSRKRGNSCDGKIVEIDGVRYQLKEVE